VTSERSLHRLSLGLVITVVLLAFDALAVATIRPRVAHDLHGDDLYGWLFSAFMLANLVIVLSGARRFPPDPPDLERDLHLTSADGETS